MAALNAGGSHGDGKSTVDCAGVPLTLLPDGAVYWSDAGTLWLSDLHLGKAAHFRKHGVPIGSESTLSTLHRLREQILHHRPVRVLLLGDLFHSDINREWVPFAGLCGEFSGIEWVLVRGNHDMIPSALLSESGIAQVDRLDDGGFTFTHDPADAPEHFVPDCVREAVVDGLEVIGVCERDRERLILASAAVVDRPSDQLLARSTFAHYQYGTLHGCCATGAHQAARVRSGSRLRRFIPWMVTLRRWMR